MTAYKYKFVMIFFGSAISASCFAEEGTIIKLGKSDAHDFGKNVKIELLLSLAEHSYSLGSHYLQEEDKDISIERVSAGDHGFVYTSEGDLFIDNFYVGRYDAKDSIQFGYNRVWVNGSPVALSKVSKRQAKIIYDLKPAVGVQADGSVQQCKIPYSIFLKPVTGSGGSGNNDKTFVLKEGMHVLRFENGVMYVNGISYGRVAPGAEIRIIDGKVSINGALTLPKPVLKSTDNIKK